MSDEVSELLPRNFWISEIPEGLERVMCHECGTLWCDTFVPDINRHRYWHKAVIEMRTVHGRHLLGPDEIEETHHVAIAIFDGAVRPIPPFSLRVDATLLYAFASYCKNICAAYEDGKGWWADFDDFDKYLRWQVIACKGFYDLIGDGGAVYREILHRLKVIPYISTSIYDQFFPEQSK